MAVGEQEPGQFILPGFQEVLKVTPEKEQIPANHVENISSTEGLFTIDDIKQVIIRLGIYAEGEVDVQLREWRRGRHFVSDAVAGLFLLDHAFVFHPNSQEFRAKFEELYGVPCKVKNWSVALGGTDCDPNKANLPTTPS